MPKAYPDIYATLGSIPARTQMCQYPPRDALRVEDTVGRGDPGTEVTGDEETGVCVFQSFQLGDLVTMSHLVLRDGLGPFLDAHEVGRGVEGHDVAEFFLHE